MESMITLPCAVLECLVVVFQIGGVASLCLSRFFPGTRWAQRGRAGFVAALVGLGIAGAICGRHDSHFALIAGVTMTVLLIGMIAGNAPIELAAPIARTGGVKRQLVG